jgi:hypothetical protein
MVCHEKVLIRHCTQKMMSISRFSHKDFYKRDKKDIHYADCVSPKLSSEVIGVFSQHIGSSTFFFPTRFLKEYT